MSSFHFPSDGPDIIFSTFTPKLMYERINICAETSVSSNLDDQILIKIHENMKGINITHKFTAPSNRDGLSGWVFTDVGITPENRT